MEPYLKILQNWGSFEDFTSACIGLDFIKCLCIFTSIFSDFIFPNEIRNDSSCSWLTYGTFRACFGSITNLLDRFRK